MKYENQVAYNIYREDEINKGIYKKRSLQNNLTGVHLINLLESPGHLRLYNHDHCLYHPLDRRPSMLLLLIPLLTFLPLQLLMQGPKISEQNKDKPDMVQFELLCPVI